MSPEAQNLVFWMVKELSSLKYCYRQYVEGCYEVGIKHRGYAVPRESRDEVVDHVIGMMKAMRG